jgi:hypothetical protein
MVINAFLVTIFAQASLAILQYVLQESVGLGFLGEPNIGQNVPGVAKIALEKVSLIRAYGTFEHPNILGAGLLIGIHLVWERLARNTWFYGVLFGFFILVLVLTFSRSAFLGLGFYFLIRQSFQKIDFKKFNVYQILLFVSLALFFTLLFNLDKVLWDRMTDFSGNWIEERTMYFRNWLEIIRAYPLGLGYGGSVQESLLFYQQNLQPWVYQPVHNVYLLFGGDYGIPGLALMLWGIYYFARKLLIDQNYALFSLFASLCLMGLFDHYFYTSYAGGFMVAFLFKLRFSVSTVEKFSQRINHTSS